MQSRTWEDPAWTPSKFAVCDRTRSGLRSACAQDRKTSLAQTATQAIEQLDLVLDHQQMDPVHIMVPIPALPI